MIALIVCCVIVVVIVAIGVYCLINFLYARLSISLVVPFWNSLRMLVDFDCCSDYICSVRSPLRSSRTIFGISIPSGTTNPPSG